MSLLLRNETCSCYLAGFHLSTFCLTFEAYSTHTDTQTHRHTDTQTHRHKREELESSSHALLRDDSEHTACPDWHLVIKSTLTEGIENVTIAFCKRWNGTRKWTHHSSISFCLAVKNVASTSFCWILNAFFKSDRKRDTSMPITLIATAHACEEGYLLNRPKVWLRFPWGEMRSGRNIFSSSLAWLPVINQKIRRGIDSLWTSSLFLEHGPL